MLATLVACSSSGHKVTPKASTNAPTPRLADFVAPDQQVTAVQQVNLDGGPVHQVVVTTTKTAAQTGAARDLLLLSWDGFAKRWTVAFDAAKQAVDIGGDTGAPGTIGLPLSSLPSKPLLPVDQAANPLTVTEIHDAPGKGSDLAIWTNLVFADGEGLLAAVLHYENQQSQIVWSFTNSESGSVTVVGNAPNQSLQVSTAWETGVDPHCCPVRPYEFTVARHDSDGARTFAVVQDDRPWLGAYITDNSEVAAIAKGSPGDGVLLPLDILQGVEGTASPSNITGPSIVDVLAVHHAGDRVVLQINRGGKLVALPVTLISRSDPAAMSAHFPGGGYLGITTVTLTPAIATRYSLPYVAGALVQDVASGSPAAQAGLTSGEIVTDAGGFQVKTADDLSAVVSGAAPGTPISVRYIGTDGVPQNVQATLAYRPSTDTQILYAP